MKTSHKKSLQKNRTMIIDGNKLALKAQQPKMVTTF
jgi:hypothetical protein